MVPDKDVSFAVQPLAAGRIVDAVIVARLYLNACGKHAVFAYDNQRSLFGDAQQRPRGRQRPEVEQATVPFRRMSDPRILL